MNRGGFPNFGHPFLAPGFGHPVPNEQPFGAMTPFGAGFGAPFGGMDMFGGMNQMMMQMQQQMSSMQQQVQTMQANPQCQFYSSSSFYSYDGSGGQPHTYEAHASTRTGPGGIKETRKAVRDSRSGEEKMAIGHHMQERAYIREKRRNHITSEEEEQEDLIGMDHEELPEFQRQWEEHAPPGRHRSGHHRALTDSHQRALTDGRRQY